MNLSELTLSPFFHPSVGPGALRPLFDAMDGAAASYPAYDIERTGEHAYRISLAVAGFKPGELNVEARGNLLSVRARRDEKTEKTEKTGKAGKQETRDYLYRGIRRRGFSRSFSLADHVRVQSAEIKDGLLQIDLLRETPEAEKPRQIEVKAA